MERLGRLLLIEDEQTLRELVAQFLRASRYEVVEAADGREGVGRYEDSGEFDLALVDLNLPYLSGIEVCRHIRKQNPDQRILICSAAIMPESETSLRDVGVCHFLTKPYHPETLLIYIRELLRGNSPPPQFPSLSGASHSGRPPLVLRAMVD